MIRAVSALWHRELLKFVRDLNRVMGAVLQPLVVWLLLGFGFHGTFRLPDSATAQVPYLEYLFPGVITLVALFTSIFSTISIVEERKSGFLQAALAAPVPRSALVLGTTLGGTTLAVGEGVLFCALLPFTGHVPTAGGFALMLLVMALIGMAFTSLGVIIAWRTRTTRGFHAVMNLFLLPLWVLSGAFFPAEGAPAVLRWTIRINPVSYGVDALRRAMYLPGSPPVESAGFGLALAVTAAFTLFVFLAAVRTVNHPLGAR